MQLLLNLYGCVYEDHCAVHQVRNTADAQPLYDDVLSLYAALGMPLPTRPPLMLVRGYIFSKPIDQKSPMSPLV